MFDKEKIWRAFEAKHKIFNAPNLRLCEKAVKLYCVKCGYLLPKDESAKSLLPFEVYRCRNCGDGFLLDMATKEAYLIPKSLGLFEMTLEKVKKAISQIPYDEDY